MRRCFLTGCFTGLLPKAPGTWGSLAGAISGYLLTRFLPQSTLFLLAMLTSLVAIKEINRFEAEGGLHDDPSIVIDEVVGIWVAISFLPDTSWPWIGVAFLLFRLFDITKPSLIKRLDQLPGGIGVVGDDLLAGVVAALSTGLCYLLAHKLF
ncbi:MAG: phosphatidylglycerophosphatase A [Nitratiruptor sp.]|nr:phosphatidylglycerophosphatase A [Nitratiruptor sp.]NPA84235.1 phosphatidylglycerophosphatase A [Campylobacterota bacterium]